MKCPKCNQEIDDDSIYCDYCGTKIEQFDSAQSCDKVPIVDRVAEVVRKTVGGGVKTFHKVKDKAKTNLPIFKEKATKAIKNFNDSVARNYKEINEKIKNNKKID